MQKSQSKQVLILLIILPFISLGYSMPLEDLHSEDIIDLSDLDESAFVNPDFEITGALVEAYNKDSLQNPEELGTYFEGDILFPKSYKNARSGLRSSSNRWTGGVVPYVIDESFTSQDLHYISHAFKEYHTKTCVRFVPRTTEEDYISITNDRSGCHSAVGRIGGVQQVNLQSSGCLRDYGTAIHELMHAVGFLHEQSRHDRDFYIRVIHENIKPGKEHNFDKGHPYTHSSFGVDYDYASVMHYSPFAFSRNNGPTLVALRNTPDTRKMGNRDGFSTGDLRKINAMYKC
ncbi:astacin-like [Drosophila elegans]|uniref:astacin-like n=1 Tax=Drosophila elegans TaxID=30023 RepID=UPI0007E817DE|nr:astacin-like [Drosophila elegans]